VRSSRQRLLCLAVPSGVELLQKKDALPLFSPPPLRGSGGSGMELPWAREQRVPSSSSPPSLFDFELISAIPLHLDFIPAPPLVPDLPSNLPLLPSSLHSSPTSASLTVPHRASSRLTIDTSSSPSSSQPTYPSSSSSSTSQDASSPPERLKPPILGMRKSSSYSKRQGKQPAVDNEGESSLRSPGRSRKSCSL
jgi:hypothetical protein